MNREQVVTKILETAANNANEKIRGMIPLVDGAIFVPNSLASRTQGFCLTYSEEIFHHIPLPEVTTIRDQLEHIAVSCVKEAIIEHGKDFASLIVSHARYGQNFFA